MGQRGSSKQSKTLAASTLVLIALVLAIGIVIIRHKRSVTFSQGVGVAPSRVAGVPKLSEMSRRPGHAAASLDAIAINGKSTIVAGLKARRMFRVARTDTVEFAGWAFDPARSAPAGALLFRFGSRDVGAAYGLARNDVASAYKMPSLTLVGFNALVSGRSLRPGSNPVSLIVVSQDFKRYYINPSEVVLDVH